MAKEVDTEIYNQLLKLTEVASSTNAHVTDLKSMVEAHANEMHQAKEEISDIKTDQEVIKSEQKMQDKMIASNGKKSGKNFKLIVLILITTAGSAAGQADSVQGLIKNLLKFLF